ncbi:MAG: 2-C-methyl-D-erythritol 4-phosphate cytidylyltransferase [Gammaproteobacteria bacterium]|nr:2-C-methyl-D-erythritol 4-phosphate cytidylyltransferase [Gammaproteobacteria bacterium]
MNHIWAVIPAAGVGKRMQADRPKQYLQLHQKTVLQHTIERMAAHPSVTGVVVAISPGDGYWPDLAISIEKPLHVVDGGDERCHSVLNGLTFLMEQDFENAWALVHDAARPCVRQEDVTKLINRVVDAQQGGLLGLPVSDTIKFCDNSDVVQKTVSRDGLWRALTPQMFRVRELYDAIRQSLEDLYLVTDEASAIEHVGGRPLMVEGHPDNIKITRPQDLMLAEMFLQQQES